MKKRISWNKGTGIKKYCIDCKKLLATSSRYLRKGIATIRCRECWYVSTRINFIPHPNSLKALKPKSSEWLKINKIHLGHPHSEESKKLISDHRIGKVMENENIQWKGDDVGYSSLHSWVSRRLGKPDMCEFCGESGLFGKKINWANKSGKYLRIKSDWLRLCRSCHAIYDNAGYKAWETRRLYE